MILLERSDLNPFDRLDTGSRFLCLWTGSSWLPVLRNVDWDWPDFVEEGILSKSEVGLKVGRSKPYYRIHSARYTYAITTMSAMSSLTMLSFLGCVHSLIHLGWLESAKRFTLLLVGGEGHDGPDGRDFSVAAELLKFAGRILRAARRESASPSLISGSQPREAPGLITLHSHTAQLRHL